MMKSIIEVINVSLLFWDILHQGILELLLAKAIYITGEQNT